MQYNIKIEKKGKTYFLHTSKNKSSYNFHTESLYDLLCELENKVKVIQHDLNIELKRESFTENSIKIQE